MRVRGNLFRRGKMMQELAAKGEKWFKSEGVFLHRG